MEWKTIDSAPKDGAIVLLCGGFTSKAKPAVRTGHWHEGPRKQGWKDEALGFCAMNPTHWMPLPEPIEP